MPRASNPPLFSRVVVRALLAATLAASASLASGGEGEPSPFRFDDASHLLAGPTSLDPDNAPRHDYGPLWGDLDGDGRLDLLFMNHGDAPSIYLNHDGRFADHLAKSGLKRGDWAYPQQADRHGAACADFDHDSDMDLFITHGAMRGETLGIKSDELLVNQGDGTFVDRASESGVRNDQGRARTPVWLDYDNDGWLDLLIGNHVSDNVLLKNRGDGSFLDVTSALGLGQRGGAHPSWSDHDGDYDPDLLFLWPVFTAINNGNGTFTQRKATSASDYPRVPSPVAASWGDHDGDGDADVFITSRIAGHSGLYENQSGRFTRMPIDLGLGDDEAAAGVAFGDLDNDGDLDLVLLGTRQVRLLENRGSEGFHSTRLDGTAFRPGVDGDVALSDYDGDGRLDIAINGEDGQHLYRNATASDAWAVIQLRGSASNSAGLGAVLEITSGARTFRRQHQGDTGFHKSVSCEPSHIGLGPSTVLGVSVRWPSGRRMRLDSVPADHHLVLMEPSS